MKQLALIVFSVVCTQAYYVFLNPETQLVFDAAEKRVRLQNFNDTPSQKWSLESIDYGKYYIVNAQNQDVLTVEVSGVAGSYIITAPRNCTKSQQWFINYDKTLTNPDDNLVPDISVNAKRAGAYLHMWHKNNEKNQIYQLYCVKK